jgi:hypothetical protein
LRNITKIWCPRVISNEKLWEITGEININMERRKRKFSLTGHTAVSLARQLCNGIHKVQEEREDQEIHGDELYTEGMWEAHLK